MPLFTHSAISGAKYTKSANLGAKICAKVPFYEPIGTVQAASFFFLSSLPFIMSVHTTVTRRNQGQGDDNVQQKNEGKSFKHCSSSSVH